MFLGFGDQEPLGFTVALAPLLALNLPQALGLLTLSLSCQHPASLKQIHHH